ncbi:MAG: aquaporin [Phycisphaerales bacterium]|nr:aquaporin [Phycisphaerales bacterium]
MRTTLRENLSEFIGTFALVFFGVLSILLTNPGVTGAPSGAGLLTVALAHGLVLSIMVTACMGVSGGQLNPAVSIGLVFAGLQTPARAARLVLSQCLGAACAAGMVVLLLGAERANNSAAGTDLGATIGNLTRQGEVLGVFGLELFATMALMVAVLMGTVDGRAHKLGGFTIGLTVTAMIVAIGPLTGASMNPARTLGPALYGHWDMIWVYLVAPTAGACIIAGVYRWVWVDPASGPREAAR